jgi:hypothetical protein
MEHIGPHLHARIIIVGAPLVAFVPTIVFLRMANRFQHGQYNQAEHDKWRVFFALEDDLAHWRTDFDAPRH